MHTLILSHLASPAALRDSPFHLLDIDRLVRYNLRTCFLDERSPFRLLDQAKKITFELTINQLMSVEPGEWTQTLHRHYVNLIEGFFALPLSLPSFFPFSSYAGAIRARRKVEASLITLIKGRRERRSSSTTTTTTAIKEEEDDEKKRDILDELLSAEEQGFYSSEDEIIDFILSLLVAGYETTSTIITLSVKFLTDNPTALAAVRGGIQQVGACIRAHHKLWAHHTTGASSSAPSFPSSPLSYSLWVMYNPQMTSQYYHHMYGPTSPNIGPPSYYPHMGYTMQSPRPSFPSVPPSYRAPYLQYPTTHMEGPFPSSSTQQYGVQLQAPPHARQSLNMTGSQSPQQPSTAAANTESPNA